MADERDTASTHELLERWRAGDAAALDTLLARHLPRLTHWAHGRLPRWARDLADTSDIVQETVIQAFKHLDTFEVRGRGALEAYLRRALINRVRSELRRVARRPAAATVDSEIRASDTSPLETAIGHQTLERYDRALAQLRPAERDAIVARFELGCTNAELAEVLGKPSPNAARMAVERALLRLARAMRDLEQPVAEDQNARPDDGS